MYKNIKFIENPKDLFKHELDGFQNGFDRYKNEFFQFIDEKGNTVDGVFLPNDNYERYYGEDIFVCKICKEVRYPQSVIDSCRKDYKKRGIKQYEWHLVKLPCVINMKTGNIIYTAKNEMDYVYVYDNLIYVSGYINGGSNKRIMNNQGEILVEGNLEFFITGEKLVVKYNHNYSTNIDSVMIIDRKTCKIENVLV